MAAPDLAAQMDAVISKGRAEYADFDDRSAICAALAGNLDELREAVGGLPDGHRVIAALADDPDAAASILPLRGRHFGMALGQFAATKAAKAPARSAQPAPARAASATPAQSTASDILDDKLPMTDWTAAMDRRAQQHREAAKAPPTTSDIYAADISTEDFNKLFDQRWAARQARRRAR